MAKIEDRALDNYANDGSQSDNESNDDLFPITTKNAGKIKRHRKRSSSLPVIEATHTGLWKGVAAATDMQFVKSNKGSHSRTEQKEKPWKGFPANESAGIEQNSLSEHHPTRRSSSMPEFYSPSSESKKDGLFRRHHKTKRSGSKSRKRVDGTVTTDLEMQEDEETFKLPIISSEFIPSAKCGSEDQNGNELEALSQSVENTKIQRKTYLPRINNSNNGGVFMKSR